jgi:hypothetical protein
MVIQQTQSQSDTEIFTQSLIPNLQNQQNDQQQQQQQDNVDDQVDDQQQDTQKDDQQDQQQDDQQQDYSDLAVIDIVKKTFQLSDDKTYNDDVDGLLEAIRDGFATKEPEIGERYIQQVFSQLPEDVAAYVEHRKQGLSPELFFKQQDQPDVLQIDISGETGQVNILKNYYKQKGLSNDEIESLIATKKNSASLEEAAKTAKKEIKKIYEAEIQQSKQAELEQIELAKQQREKTVKQIESILTLGNIKGFQLDKNEITEFKKAIFTVDEQGLTPIQRTYMQLSIEEKLAVDYLIYKKLGVNGIFKGNNSKSLSGLKKPNNQQQQQQQSQQIKTPFNLDFTKVKTSN